MGSKYYVNPDTGQRVYIKDRIPSLSQYRKAADQDEIDEEIRQDLANYQPKLPDGETGKILTKTATGVAWQDAPGGTEKQWTEWDWDTGVTKSVELAGCTEMIIIAKGDATETVSMRCSLGNFSFVYACFSTSRKMFIGRWKDSIAGVENIYCKGTNSRTSVNALDVVSASMLPGASISQITSFSLTSSVSNLDIKIYAR